MHLDEGTLRAMIDGELPEGEEVNVRAHLAECASCNEEAQKIEARSVQVDHQMTFLDPAEIDAPTTAARQRLQVRIDEKGMSMLDKIFQRKYRLAWAVVAMIAVIAISMAFPQTRAFARRVLALFRIEQIRAVEVGISIEDLPNEVETNFRTLETLLGDQIQVEELIEPREVGDVDEASVLAGFTVRLPGALEDEVQLIYQPANTVSYTIDRELWQSILDEMGYADMVLPESIDGHEMTINLPATVAALYGECQQEQVGDVQRRTTLEGCTVLLQGSSPVIDVPPELEIDRLGEILLETLGMSADEAANFSGNVNWLTTLILPIPADAQYEEISSVDGVPGVLLKDFYVQGKARYTLVWVKDGTLYGLLGAGDVDEALDIANSLE